MSSIYFPKVCTYWFLQGYSHSLWLKSLHDMLIYVTSIFIWIWDSKPPGIWTQISRTKSGYANHWATLHWRPFENFLNIWGRLLTRYSFKNLRKTEWKCGWKSSCLWQENNFAMHSSLHLLRSKESIFVHLGQHFSLKIVAKVFFPVFGNPLTYYIILYSLIHFRS